MTKSKTEEHVFHSGFWDVPLEKAETLIGGMLFLHETKAKPSRFGGQVLAVEQVEAEEFSRAMRVVIHD